MTNIHHAIDYVEINVGSAMGPTRDFYAEAFGWEFADYGPDYAGIKWSSGEGEVGGLNAAKDGSRGGVLVLLYSDDLDATAALVADAGGEVVEGPYDFPGGRRFHFLDPAGNELGVWATS